MSTEHEKETTASTPATQQYSKYKALQPAEPLAPAPEQLQPVDEFKRKEDGLARSMSRYRRSRVTQKTESPVESPPAPPAPAVPLSPRQSSSQLAGPFQPLKSNICCFGSSANEAPRSQRRSSHESNDDYEEENRPRQIPSHVRQSVALPARDSRRQSAIRDSKMPPAGQVQSADEKEDIFAETGLLGRTYTLRQQKARGPNRRSSNLPPLTSRLQRSDLVHRSSVRSRPGLGHSRSVSTRSTSDRSFDTANTSLQQRWSQWEDPKPLLDLTPTFKEAPQWDMSKKGRGVRGVEGVPLVEFATGPVLVDGGSPGANATVFRRDQVVVSGQGMRRQPTVRRDKDLRPFVKGGLVEEREC